MSSDEELMRAALGAAREAATHGDVPIGAVLAVPAMRFLQTMMPETMAVSVKLLSEISSKTWFCFFQSTLSAIGGGCVDSGCAWSVCQITTRLSG